jgi:uncharacterized membrane protein YdjX (TVP38/TMEM64 family)
LTTVLVVSAALALTQLERFDPDALRISLAGAGEAAVWLFIAIYIVAAVLFVPGSLLTFSGGALFGPLWGTLYNLIGAALGAALSFAVARYLSAEWALDRNDGRIKQLIEGVEREGWRFVALVRLMPWLPYNVVNYALGLTRISFWTHTVTTTICLLPIIAIYSYVGHAGLETLTGGENAWTFGITALALLAVSLYLPRLITLARKR